MTYEALQMNDLSVVCRTLVGKSTACLSSNQVWGLLLSPMMTCLNHTEKWWLICQVGRLLSLVQALCP